MPRKLEEYTRLVIPKFNELNLQLQGSELNLIKMRSLISPFMSKLAMFKRNLGGREFYQFPSAAALRENGEVHDDDIQIYCDHLDMLQKDMQERFQDILNWMIDLFSNSNEIEMELKEELIDLQTNEELKPKFKDGYHSFCLQNKYLTSIPNGKKVPKSVCLAKAFNLFLLARHIHQQLKDCRTTLIPKTDDPRPDAEDYRQITIVSCVYRLFSKIVTRRLEDSLSFNPRQKALRSSTDGAFDNTST
ncbi:hypothetical protein T06_1959 [Trichinella sp. T6]|nr:hypothetical protein T06_1959 [Trichinella sp. T6]